FERGDRGFRFEAGVDQVLGQGADDAVASGVDLADHIRMPARSFQDAAGGGVDHGADTARLGVERIPGGHDNSLVYDTPRGAPGECRTEPCATVIPSPSRPFTFIRLSHAGADDPPQ